MLCIAASKTASQYAALCEKSFFRLEILKSILHLDDTGFPPLIANLMAMVNHLVTLDSQRSVPDCNFPQGKNSTQHNLIEKN